MTFYIPEFWCGVFITLMLEFMILAMIAIARKDDTDGTDKR